MKKIIAYLKDYCVWIDKRIFFLSVLFTAIAIFINYYHGLNNTISTFNNERQYVSWYFIFLAAFSFAYFLQAVIKKTGIFNNWKFLILLFIAPAIFSWKMTYDVEYFFTENIFLNAYWNTIIYWPFKLLIVTVVILILYFFFQKDGSYYGLTIKNFNAKPYLLMLLIMVPLVAAASTQQDFLNTYPKLKEIHFLQTENNSLYYFLYELSYGTDFFTIEIFFRGFLVLAFVKWVGKDAILPMAIFYCTIHFGKPLGECISSFFGGLILGVVTYHTKTIFGGLLVHVGIAWMMELGGYLGTMYITAGT